MHNNNKKIDDRFANSSIERAEHMHKTDCICVFTLDVLLLKAGFVALAEALHLILWRISHITTYFKAMYKSV